MLSQVREWDDAAVERWLSESRVGQYGELFRQNDIRGAILLDVDQAALKEMGVKSVGDRVRIAVAIKALRRRCTESTWSGLGAPLSPSRRPANYAASSEPTSARSMGQSPPWPRNHALTPTSVQSPMLSHPFASAADDDWARVASSSPRRGSADAPHGSPVRAHASSSSPTKRDGFLLADTASRPTTAQSGSSLVYDVTRELDEALASSSHGTGALGRSNSTTITPSSSTPSLQDVLRKAVKVVTEDGASKMVAVSDCTDGRQVLHRVLRKFGKISATDVEDSVDAWALYLTSDISECKSSQLTVCRTLTHCDQARPLSDTELLTICRDGSFGEKQRVLALKRYTRSSKRERKLAWMFGEDRAPESHQPGGVSDGMLLPLPSPDSSPYRHAPGDLLGARESGHRPNRASMVSVMSGLGADWSPPDPADAAAERRTSSSSFMSTSGRRLRSFLGHRPPSELIASHMSDFFHLQKAEERMLSKPVRESMRRSMIRRESFLAVGKSTWAARGGDLDRDISGSSADSRFSMSSAGSAAPMATPSILEPPDESAESSSFVSYDRPRLSSQSSHLSSSRRSTASIWDRRSRDSDAASTLTVDEITAELENRRASLQLLHLSEEQSTSGSDEYSTRAAVSGFDTDSTSVGSDSEGESSDDAITPPPSSTYLTAQAW